MLKQGLAAHRKDHLPDIAPIERLPSNRTRLHAGLKSTFPCCGEYIPVRTRQPAIEP
jgi:hypothetical protein